MTEARAPTRSLIVLRAKRHLSESTHTAAHTMEPHPAIPGLYAWDTQQDLEQLRAAVRTLFDGSSETRGHSRRRMSACKEFGVEFSSAEKEGKYTVNELNLRNPAHAVIAKFIAGELARHEGDVIEQSGATVVPCNLLSTNVVIRRSVVFLLERFRRGAAQICVGARRAVAVPRCGVVVGRGSVCAGMHG